MLIDHGIGFANLFRSHTVAENVNGVVALARIARIYGVPLIVTSGPDNSPVGPLYPQLAAVLGDHPVVLRSGAFDAFEEEAFTRAIEATGRQRLVMAGLMTEGCLLHTALGAVEQGYEVRAVLDASACVTTETHELAVRRMTQAGVIPTSWLSVAAEYQVTWANAETADGFRDLVGGHSPTFAMQGAMQANIERHAAS
ncbi:isochorismatase family protein [Actinocrispum wychmicini]|uniref:isochorismatase family protein n=1 Tax=Actinocrispum wychmicini TaxID=1213861 RepID=UPI001A9DC39D|nr:isochorismatase family protein [Actinocrispum wychmicini]